MKIQQLPVEQALLSLRSTRTGLDSAEALRRRNEFGPNRIIHAPRVSHLSRFARSLTNFFALVLWVAAALAAFAHWREPGQGMGALAWAIVGVILINAVFSFWQEYRAQRTINALENLLPRRAQVMRDGKACAIDAVDVVPGDIVVLGAGDDVPADARLLESFGVQISMASITGESFPVARDATRLGNDDVAHSPNILLAGTSLLAGDGLALVFATGASTEFGKIARLSHASGSTTTPLQREIARVSRIVTILSTVLGLVFFGIGYALGLSFWQNFMFAIGIIVANVPEGLLPTVTLALALAAQRMAKKNALIRHLPSVETLGSTTVICTDKTGTLTQNRMQVRAVFDGNAIVDRAPIALLEAAAWCHYLKTDIHEEYSGHPLERALVLFAHDTLGSVVEPPRTDEIPFDAQRRMSSTVHRIGGNNVVHSKGALEALLPRCTTALINEQILTLDAPMAARYRAMEEQLAVRGLRVLAFARRTLPADSVRARIEEQMTLLGLIGIADPPRPEVPDAIARCRAAGVRVLMLTGDHPHTALAIARDIGLVSTHDVRIVTGDTLDHLSKAQLNLALDAGEILFARVAPQQKLRIVQALQETGEVVAVTGDGVNDAPALKQADIGIAMGRSGTDVAREASRMVLLDDNFATIVGAIEEGRAVFANIRKFLTYILTSNVPELVPYLAFVLFAIPLPLTVLQILAVDLGTDMLPALALGAERPDPTLMKQPPRARHTRLLDRALLLRAYLFLGPLEAAAAMTVFFFVLWQAGWNYGTMLAHDAPLYLAATTACLATIVVMQIMNVFLCRSETRSIAHQPMFDNPLLLPALATEIGIILWIVYSNGGNAVFGTAPLNTAAWWVALACAPVMLLAEELRKWRARARA